MLLTPVIIECLEALLADRGTNQKNVALAAGLSATAMRDVLKGRSKNPGVETLAALAGVLGVSVAYLIGETDDPGLPLAPHAPSTAPNPKPQTVQDARARSVANLDPPGIGLELHTPDGVARYSLKPEQAAYIARLLDRAFDQLLNSETTP